MATRKTQHPAVEKVKGIVRKTKPSVKDNLSKRVMTETKKRPQHLKARVANSNGIAKSKKR